MKEADLNNDLHIDIIEFKQSLKNQEEVISFNLVSAPVIQTYKV